MTEISELQNAARAIDLAGDMLSLVAGTWIDERPQSEWEPVFTLAELHELGDGAPTQTWCGSDPHIEELQAVTAELFELGLRVRQLHDDRVGEGNSSNGS